MAAKFVPLFFNSFASLQDVGCNRAWILRPKKSEKSDISHIYIYIHTHIYMYIHLCVYMYMYMYVWTDRQRVSFDALLVF